MQCNGFKVSFWVFTADPEFWHIGAPLAAPAHRYDGDIGHYTRDFNSHLQLVTKQAGRGSGVNAPLNPELVRAAWRRMIDDLRFERM
jgi:hypothetical protein